MKKLSDYKGEDAIDLWADLLEPLSTIFTNQEIVKIYRDKTATVVSKSKAILKECRKETIELLERIDDTPVDGLNIIIRLIELLSELESEESLKGFFGFAGQATMENVSSGSVTESTEGSEN